MKRGFLLRAEQKRAAAERRGARMQTEPSVSPPTVAAQPSPTFKGVTEKGRILGKLAYGNLTAEEKALPSDYDLKTPVYKELDPHTTNAREDMTVVTTIPQPCPDGEPQSEWLVNGSTKAKVLNAPGYPACIPKPRRPDLYQVRSTPDMGEAVFANRNIKRGDLFLAERPMLVASSTIKPPSGAIPDHYTALQIQQIVMFEFERQLETAIRRLPTETQADFRALHNAHTNDGSGPLLGILRTNSYGTRNLYDGSNTAAAYAAVCKIASRLNHSCMPNVRYYFKLDSFSIQFYATRDIKAGEQLFSSYCSPDRRLAQRQASLAPYGFLCKCPACANATAETDKLRDTFVAQIHLFKTLVEESSEITETALGNAVALEKDMVKEGLDADPQYVTLLMAIYVAYARKGNLEEREKYGVLVESFRGCFTDE